MLIQSFFLPEGHAGEKPKKDRVSHASPETVRPAFRRVAIYFGFPLFIFFAIHADRKPRGE